MLWVLCPDTVMGIALMAWGPRLRLLSAWDLNTPAFDPCHGMRRWVVQGAEPVLGGSVLMCGRWEHDSPHPDIVAQLAEGPVAAATRQM